MRIKRLYEYNDDEFEEEDDVFHENEDNVCYYCGSRNLDYEDFDFQSPVAIQYYGCADCNSLGRFIYDVKFVKNKGDTNN